MAAINPIPTTNILSRLWIGEATIYEYQEVTDPNTHQTTTKPVAVYEKEPCRVSYSTEQVTTLNEAGVADLIQKITLFIRPDIEIKAGSLIEITQHGRTNTYKRASEPAVYTNHQEIAINIDKDI